MKVVLLGTAAGGGFPQWNCACALCAAARDGKLPARTQECVAVSGNSRDWWLLNASPDIRTQLTATPELAPGPGPRDTPVRGVLLTDAEADHVMGLTILRGGAALKVYAAPPVLATLAPLRAMLDRYAPWEWADSLTEGGFVLAGGLVVSAHPVGSKAPKYADGAAADAPWVTAYRIEDLATGGVLVYAPCLGRWTPELDALLATATCALLDGTFYAADEMGTAVRSPNGQAAMGHLPVSGARGSLTALARHLGPRRIYTHLNNTNPLLDPASDARARVTATGVEVLPDGSQFVV
ncbi:MULTISPECIES: pyrroloquinoline quinone biosynthesis protein PqqB [Streptomyces]|uniref:Coenzyme PQQ synthesis protein B n=1 Tax=Streptomyces dengpaensis TaxID=2049881 RepID=A0ABM6T141_9ACTN|nr:MULTISPECIES: pyrroloquinoline quinone biosynthesis protein PqqB [Streptomyces]AVH60394.1 pyrroloquinoline quinone biosynthesis protein PqqB [Streptomyces dengpaensis]PIB07687.1 pyrroloquinoline quinone biosynthesis protein PqqB [Streptomyces sp. HG99]